MSVKVLEFEAVVDVLLAAAVAVEVLVDEALLFDPLIEHTVLPVPVGGAAALDGVSAPVQEVLDAFGQLGAVLGLGGNVVGGAGLVVAALIEVGAVRFPPAGQRGVGEMLIPYDGAFRLARANATDQQAADLFDVSLAVARWRMNHSGARKVVERTRSKWASPASQRW